MSYETDMYSQEIQRLKERVNTLIDVILYAIDHAYDPNEWLFEKGDDLNNLDKEVPNKYTE